jgi:hypothetical protein
LPDDRYPGIPSITDDRVVAPTVRAIQENVELLTGQRGTNPGLVAATAGDINILVNRIAALEARVLDLETP